VAHLVAHREPLGLAQPWEGTDAIAESFVDSFKPS
jgi:hypothetical protein